VTRGARQAGGAGEAVAKTATGSHENGSRSERAGGFDVFQAIDEARRPGNRPGAAPTTARRRSTRLGFFFGCEAPLAATRSPPRRKVRSRRPSTTSPPTRTSTKRSGAVTGQGEAVDRSRGRRAPARRDARRGRGARRDKAHPARDPGVGECRGHTPPHRQRARGIRQP